MAERIVHSSSFIIHRDTNLTDLTDSTASPTIPTHRPYRLTDTLTHQPAENVPWEIPAEYEGITAYNPRHDIQDFLNLQALNGRIAHQEFAELRTQTINRKQRDLVKMLGERFAVERSKITYYVENGQLKSPDYPGPVIDEWKKGQQFLKAKGSVETERENAEVRGAEVLENIIAKRKLKEGESIVVVSAQGPKGTLYKDNFFDVYKPNGDQIEMTRFHSLHSYEGFLEAAKKADQYFETPDGELDAAYFLQKPIVTTLSDDEIFDIFALDPDTQSEKVHQQIVEVCTPYILFYVRQLAENPLDLAEVNKRFNAIPNVADEEERKIKRHSQEKVLNKNLEYQQRVEAPRHFRNISGGADFYGRQEVRPVDRGCPGGQRGFSVNQSRSLSTLADIMSAQSVVDFASFSSGEDEYGTLQIHCEECDSTYLRTSGKLEKNCRHCGGTRGIVC